MRINYATYPLTRKHSAKHTTRISRLRLNLGILILSACFFLGCDTKVEPVRGTDLPFSLFGLFSPQLDTQRVLVFPVEPTLRLLPDAPLDAQFVSVNLETQEEMVWSDSLIPQENGGHTHLFWSPFQAAYGSDYRVIVSDELGNATEVLVKVPPTSEIEILPPSVSSDIILPVLVRGDVENLNKVEVKYGVDYRQASAGPKIEDVTFPHDDRTTRTPEGWLIRINLRSDFRRIEEFIRSQRAIDISYGIFLRGIQLRFIAASADWAPPDDNFDPEVLVQPGTLSNVVNGFGFVGAGYRSETSWLPADSVLQLAGFRNSPP